MLVLYETAAGFNLFKVSQDKKSEEMLSAAHDKIKLVSSVKFGSVGEAVSSAAALAEGKMSKELKKFLKSELEGRKDQLAVVDAKLAGRISRKLGLQVVSDASVHEAVRAIRSHAESLLQEAASTSGSSSKMGAMQLGLAHSLSRMKLKFSPERVADTMVVQAIGLLDELDKELNTYGMRLREWYGWHFPELSHVLPAGDNVTYAKVVNVIGQRSSLFSSSSGELEQQLSELLPEELDGQVKQAAQTSMGTDISEQDLTSIRALADQVVALGAYRAELSSYLRNRMLAIAPNLTAMVGELVGARLIAHAGSLISLAKQPASTLQILGAEKALFRALKTRANTPKYGLLFHASLVGQAAPRLKGKISRVLAAKTALAVRVDAFSDEPATSVVVPKKKNDSSDAEEDDATTAAAAASNNNTKIKNIALENRIKVEQRLRQLEGKARSKLFGRPLQPPPKSLSSASAASFTKPHVATYNPASDIVLDTTTSTASTAVAAADTKKKDLKKEEKKSKKEKSSSSEKEEKKSKKEKSSSSEKEEKKSKRKRDSSTADDTEKKDKKKKSKE